MAFKGYWREETQTNRFTGAKTVVNAYYAEEEGYPDTYTRFWQGIRYTLPQIQGFEFELRDIMESYAILSKQAIALGRSDLVDETLAGVRRVNAMKDSWTKLNTIIYAYIDDWPIFWTTVMGADDYVTRRSTTMDSRLIAGIFFTTSYDALDYVSVYWPQLREQWSTENYTLRQLEKKFTPAEIIAVPEPYIPVPEPYIPLPYEIQPEDILIDQGGETKMPLITLKDAIPYLMTLTTVEQVRQFGQDAEAAGCTVEVLMAKHYRASQLRGYLSSMVDGSWMGDFPEPLSVDDPNGIAKTEKWEKALSPESVESWISELKAEGISSESVLLAGFPTWAIILLAGAGIFMFLKKGKGK